MGAEKAGAEIVVERDFAFMGGAKITAEIVEEIHSVSMGGAKIFAKIVAELPYVCILDRFKLAISAVSNVVMTNREGSAKFARYSAVFTH